jgi:molybdopterin-guanine dinucleotide biosynthesis protein A
LVPFTAVLLAGGRSRRMGRDKAAVDFGGKPLWQHQLETLQAAGPGEIFVSGPTDGPYAGCRVVSDEHPGLGPLAGLSVALKQAGHELVFVLAIDLPLMTSEFVLELLGEAAERHCGIVPAELGRFHPLAAVYPRDCLGLVNERLHSEDRAMQRFVRIGLERGLLRERPLTAKEAALFENINTPEDLRRLGIKG